jgi:hypothetical protein
MYPQEEGVDSICKRSACSQLVSAAEKAMFGSMLSRLDDQESGAPIGSTPSAEDFVNEWLGAIADAIVGLIVAQIGNIRILTSIGAAQLVVDIEYIRSVSCLSRLKYLMNGCGMFCSSLRLLVCSINSNVVNAMGLRQHPLLSHIRQLLLRPPAALGAAIDLIPGTAHTLPSTPTFRPYVQSLF